MSGKAIDRQRQHADIHQRDGQAAECFGDGFGLGSGIGYVLARYKQMKKAGGETIVCNLSRLNKTIFEMSGIFRIIRYERNEGRR